MIAAYATDMFGMGSLMAGGSVMTQVIKGDDLARVMNEAGWHGRAGARCGDPAPGRVTLDGLGGHRLRAVQAPQGQGGEGPAADVRARRDARHRVRAQGARHRQRGLERLLRDDLARRAEVMAARTGLDRDDGDGNDRELRDPRGRRRRFPAAPRPTRPSRPSSRRCPVRRLDRCPDTRFGGPSKPRQARAGACASASAARRRRPGTARCSSSESPPPPPGYRWRSAPHRPRRPRVPGR